MKVMRRSLCSIVLIVLFVAFPAMAGTILVDKNNTSGITDGTAEHPYTSIQSAIDHASSGDEVIVQTGVYYDNIQIHVPVRLTSSGGATISAFDPTKTIIDVKSDGVQISGFIITGANLPGWWTQAAINLNSQNNCIISSNTVTANKSTGIILYGPGSNNTISNNIIEGSLYEGILLWNNNWSKTPRNFINNNVIKNNGAGITILSSIGNTITSNEISNNGIGVAIGKPWTYYPSPDNNIIKDNNFIQNVRGINVSLYDGIYWQGTTGIKIYHNNFIDNTIQAGSGWGSGWGNGDVRWENGYIDGGNYWSDLGGPDANMDNIVDHPKDRDFFPVTSPGGWVKIVPDKAIRNANTGFEYSTISAAVREANGGDTIEVTGGNITGRGMYYDNIQINVPIILKSSNGIATITSIEAEKAIVDINSDNVKVDGFVMTGASIYSVMEGMVKINAGSQCIISNNELKNNTSGGIIIYGPGTNNTVINNVIDGNIRYNGLMLYNRTNGNIVKNNVIRSAGINIASSSNNTITGNEVSNSPFGLVLSRIWNWAPSFLTPDNNIITENNFIRNGTAVYLSNLSDTYSIGTMIYHNNYIDNGKSIEGYPGIEGTGIQWDNEYPEGGNYWSNWISPDVMSGSGQNLPGADGIVDIPYMGDRYPFVMANGWIPRNTPPAANAGPDLEVYANERFSLDATGSFDVEGPIAGYGWDFGDSTVYSESEISSPDGAFDGKTAYVYNQSGSFTVTLTVTDSAGALASDTVIVRVISISDGLNYLRDLIGSVNLPRGPETALLAKIDAAQDALNSGDDFIAKTSLCDLISQLAALCFVEKYHLEDFARIIIPEIQRIIALL